MNQRLARLWRKRLDDLAASLLPVAKWCDLHDIPRSRVAYWKRKLAVEGSEATDSHSGRWFSMRVAEPEPLGATAATFGGIILRMGNITLEVQPGFDAALLRSIVAAIGGVAC
jgi:hypothetical protein